ncbi:Fatty acid synthase subunit alpha, partial [Zancudomyces culisetae]
LVNGKSAMQNEIISDLQKEFQNQLPDKAEEMPLVELFGQLNNSSGGLGPFSSVRVSKLVNSKMPGGFTIPKIKEMLNKKYGLGPLRADCLLLLGTTFEPENRLANEKDMNSWLEIVANQYAKIFGIQYSQKSETSNVGTSGVTIDSKEFNEYVSHYKKLLSSQQIAISDFLGRDVSNESLTTLDDIEASYRKAKHQLDIWESEYDERYSDGIKPIFTSLKCRIFDSYWNWVEWQLERVFYDTLNLTTDVKAGDLDSEKPYFVNKSTPRLVASIRYKIKLLESNKLVNLHNHYNIVQLKLFLSDLLESCEMAVDKSPLYYGIMQYYGPKTTISNKGDIEYNEVQREGINDIIDYINSMTFGIDTGDRFDEQNEQHLLTEELLHKLSAALNLPEKLTSDDLEKISNEIRNVKNKTDGFKTKIRTLNNVEKTHIKSGLLFEDYVKFADSMIYKDRLPFLHLRRRHRYDTFNYDKASTLYYLGALLDISFNGITFASKNVLVTGCGKGSIGIEIVKALLMGGANVIATTSKFSYSAAKRFEKLYKKYGSKGSSLTLLPFNQSSQQDVNSLVDYIFLPKKSRGLGMILDAVVPFGAMSEVGKDITNLDSVSEVAHRTMMVNILRLIGRVKINKEKYGIKMRSTMVFVPLSLNHGGFGGDGLYAESKIGLETLFDKWAAESWGEYISIAGVVVGWARGTGLMNQNNILAEAMEKQGGKTFSTKEVAFNVLGLLHPEIRRLCDERPIYADISGGFGFILEFSKKTFMIRQDLINQSLIQKQIKYETSFDFKMTEGENVEDIYKQVEIKQRSNLRIDFPKLRDYSELKEKFGVGEMLNLDKTVVVVGFGEVGPFGSAETRWDMEIHDEYSNDGCIMLGWIMGFIRYHRGTLPNGQQYQGWVDAKSGDPVEDTKIKLIYGKLITEHSGLRRVDPELLEGYDPDCRKVIREVVIHEKMKPIKTTEEEARYFKLKHKETVEIWKGSGDDWFVRFLAGTKIFLPKASKFEWFVSGLVPKFWTAERYGLPLEICKRIDDLTAFCLVATNDAFMRAGIEDPYELFKFVHVSEIGNSIGSAVGGSKLAFTTLKRRYNSEYIEGGVFDECYCSSMASWVNKYILPSSGPFVVPSGTCATGAVSIDIAVQSLITGKAKIMLSGGHDDVTEECSMEFANMQATANSTTDFACGRTAKEMSRPFTSTRHGFMDSQGSAVQILMTAATALEIGLPIYGIIAYSGTSSDKVGRSFPAPGKGLITSVRESPRSIINPLLNISYRRRQLKKRLEEVDSWFSNQLNTLITDFTGHSSKSLSLNDLNEISITSPQKISELNAKLVFLNDHYSRLKKNARDYWSYDFWLKNPSISPIRGSLAAFGLTADDIDFVNCHGTSTAANDNNESEVLASQFKKLGRTYGNVCPAVSQKGLMGHTKGGAAAFAINGVLQSILTGVVPGSHNADNISNEFEDHFYVYHPSRSIKKPFIKACLMKSLGFGQIGAEILVLNPDYLFSSISEDKYLEYKSKVSKRNMYANKIFFNTMTTTKLYLTEKQRLYDESNEVSILLNPNARAEYSVEFDTFRISAEQNTSNRITSIVTPSHVYATIKSLTANAVEQDTRAPASITHTQIPKSQPQPQPQPHQAISTPTFTPRPNTEIIHIKSISVDDSEFTQTHFTELEISYCKSRPSPRASFAGKLAAKTA